MWLFDRWGDLFQVSILAGIAVLPVVLVAFLVVIQVAILIVRRSFGTLEYGLLLGAALAFIFPKRSIAALIVAALLVALTLHH